MFRATAVGAVAAGALLVALAGTAGAAVTLPPAHGDLLHVVKPGARANASQSNNWFGYNQGTLEQGSKQFHSISGDWTVPTATQHTPGQAETPPTGSGSAAGASTPTAR